MENIKVSIVVPVYNVESELIRCLESLVNQSIKNIEIILINDGSNDSSPQICEVYKNKYDNISLINKTNGGLSSARNTGLKKAKGEYILFVDSDDYISVNACEQLLKNGLEDNLDIVVGNAFCIKNNINIKMCHSENSLGRVMPGSQFLKEQLVNGNMNMASCFNLYRREFLLENSLFFKEGILHEDEDWTPRVFLIAEKVKYIDLLFYYYIIRHNSITTKVDKSQNGIDLINTCNALEKHYSNIEDKELKILLNDYLVTVYLQAIHYGDLYRRKNLYSTKFLFGKAKTKKNKIKVLLFLINNNLYKIINDISKYKVLGEKWRKKNEIAQE
ncbi:glycosyltransferase [Cytobacillus horneckiae]|uniref:glycosyltransferase n=1 Tax=Cytobacillus horneckiae TaxID=549687 RepID=UPI003D9AA238